MQEVGEKSFAWRAPVFEADEKVCRIAHPIEDGLGRNYDVDGDVVVAAAVKYEVGQRRSRAPRDCLCVKSGQQD